MCDIVLYEVDVGNIDDQKMSDIAQKMSPTVYGNHQRRGGCDESEMRRILGDWVRENPDMTTDASIKRLKVIFKDRSVLLLPVIKKLDQSLGVRKTLGAIHFNKLRRAAEMDEFSERECGKFAYQISPGLANAFHKEVRNRRYGPHTVDAMLREWYGRSQDEMSFSRIITTLRDPNMQKDKLAESLQGMHHPLKETTPAATRVSLDDQSVHMTELQDSLGALPKKEKSKTLGYKKKKQTTTTRRGSLIGQIGQTFRQVTGRKKTYDIEQEPEEAISRTEDSIF